MKRKLTIMCCIAALCGMVPERTVGQQGPLNPPPLVAEPQIGPAAGYIILPWQKAVDHVGERTLVYGKIVMAKKTNRRCYLNFHKNFRSNFTAVIDRSAYPEFDGNPEQLFRNKMVVVRGQIHMESGRPEIAITHARDVQVLATPDQDAVAQIKSIFRGAVLPEERRASAKPDSNAEQISVATYNLLNLFDEFDDPYRTDEVMRTKPRQQLEQIADRIRKLNADVLALQEVENRPYLQRFLRAFLSDMGYEHVALVEGNNARGIDVAVVSRFPIGPVTSYHNLRFKGPDGRSHYFQRDLLKVHVYGPSGFEFDVFAVHLKSKYGGAEASEPIRQAEANKIRELIDQVLYADPNARFLICGDFNDLWDSPSLKIIRGTGQTQLSCPGVQLPPDARITYNREPHRSMIDFILCSPEMLGRHVAGTYQVVPGTVDDSGSDHNPSVAAFRVR